MSRLYTALLHLYPASFRNEFGAEMHRVFESRRLGCAGPLGVLALWLEVLPDTVLTALREHAGLLSQDVRYALRMFRRSPAFAATAMLTIALGVGANTAIFTAVDRVLVRPLPFPDPDRLVVLWEDASHFGYPMNDPSPTNYAEWKRQSTAFVGMAAFRGASMNLTGSGIPERIDGAAMTVGVLPLLGVQPALGRTFLKEEDQPGGPVAVILSHNLWLRRFGADPGVLGRKIVLDGAPHIVIGVMPPGFRFPRPDAELWTAMRFTNQELSQSDNHYLRVLARLRPGVSLAQARAEMRIIAHRLELAYPDDRNIGVLVRPLRDDGVSPRSRLSLLILLGAAACILLIGCSNLANLLLARAAQRRKEIVVRSMLGAGRERLVRQILTESVLLSLAGGAAGVVLAVWTLPVLEQLVPDTLPIAQSLAIDWRVLAFALTLSVLTGVVFAILPALHVTRADAAWTARESSREGVGGRKSALRSALVVSEVAVSAMLLVAAGLLIRTLVRVQSVDPGFTADGVLTMRTSLTMPKYDRLAPRRRFYRDVLSQVRALPGVRAAGFVSFLPLTMRGGIFFIEIEGRVHSQDWSEDAMFRIVTPGYFAAMRIPLRAGRDVGEQDTLDARKVAVVSAGFARAFWPNQDCLGRRFKVADAMRTIVGVVGDVKGRGLEDVSEPQVYLPYSQVDEGYTWFAPKDLAIRAGDDPQTLLPAVRAIIRAADPDQPVSDVQTLSHLLDQETVDRRLQLRLLGAFTGLALVLAAIGIYGVLSFLVSQRTQEIGVRLALGARSGDILGMFLRRGLALTGCGLALGLAGAVLAGWTMRTLLFGLNPADPLAYGVAAGLCFAVSLLACYLPALRASRTDPMTAVRCE